MVTPYGDRKPSRTGVAVTIALHLLLVAVYLLQPKTEKHAPPKAGEAIVWMPPLQQNKPTQKQPQQTQSKPTKPTPAHTAPPRVTHVQRLPNTITLPHEKPVQEAPPPKEVVKETPKEIPQDMDMSQYIAKQREKRGAPAQSDQSAEESQSAKGMRNAMANIAAINGRGGQDPNDTGGVFSVSNQTFNSAEVKFRGWNPSFKRRWLTDVTVDRGSNPDIETAIVKKMIDLIRQEKKGDFDWESHRLNKVVTLSARPQDTQELMNFLYKEMFPDYKPPRTGGG